MKKARKEGKGEKSREKGGEKEGNEYATALTVVEWLHSSLTWCATTVREELLTAIGTNISKEQLAPHASALC